MSKIIQVLILFSLVIVPCACCSGEELLLHQKKLNGSIIYTLRENGEAVIDLWKETVNLPSDGKPMDRWCRLVASDKNHNGAVVLIENNEVEITLLQFDEKNKPLSVIKMFDPGWLKAERSGAKLSAIAPNQITVSFPNHESQTWSVVDGILMDETGNAYKRKEMIHMGSHSSEKTPKTATANIVPPAVVNNVPPESIGKVPAETRPTASAPREEPKSSTSWGIFVVLIVAAIGLLWLLVKNRQ